MVNFAWFAMPLLLVSCGFGFLAVVGPCGDWGLQTAHTTDNGTWERESYATVVLVVTHICVNSDGEVVKEWREVVERRADLEPAGENPNP